MFYELFRLEVAAREDMAHGDADPNLMIIATQANVWVKKFLSLEISWGELLSVLDSLGIDIDNYQRDVRLNHLDRGLLWLN